MVKELKLLIHSTYVFIQIIHRIYQTWKRSKFTNAMKCHLLVMKGNDKLYYKVTHFIIFLDPTMI